MEYEHMLWTQGIAAPWADRTPAAHAEALANLSSAELLPRLHRQMREAHGGGWEAVSHDLLRLDDGLLLTVLLRRPRTP